VKAAELSLHSVALRKRAIKDSPDKTDRIPGRLAFLKALDRFQPEVLRELRDEVAPKFAHLWNDMPETRRAEST
jgi:hypothetical protein